MIPYIITNKKKKLIAITIINPIIKSNVLKLIFIFYFSFSIVYSNYLSNIFIYNLII